jgi:hypothetical protein
VEAVRGGDLVAVQALLEAGADPDARDAKDAPAIVLAARAEKPAGLFEALFKAKVTVRISDKDGMTPLMGKLVALARSHLQYEDTLAARRPDKLRVYSTSAQRSRKVYYDGKTVTIYAEKLKYYGSFSAPATIGQTVEVAAQKYGLEFPLADLFLMGTDKFDTKSITEAIYVGPQLIGGVLCDQLAFRQPGVDWQVCIERGKAPLPRKLVVTGTDGDPAQPVRRSILTWKAGSAPEAAAFTFVPPKGATRIAVKEAAK